MTETGFKYFIEYMQARSAGPKPKCTSGAVIPTIAVKPKEPPRSDTPKAGSCQSPAPDEDYTGSVCLLHKLTPKTSTYEEVLLDIEDFERLKDMSWRIDRWGRNKEKYVVRKNGIQIARYIINPSSGNVADHIRSARTLDNRKSNLRVSTQSRHQVNTRRQKNGTSKYKGVQRHPSTGKWLVQCGTRKDRVFVGGFETEIEAARAYNEIARRLYGSMAYLNPV